MKTPTHTSSPEKNPLREGWYETTHVEIAGASAGIYEWRIEGFGAYVGKSKNLRSRFREYRNNVCKLLNGLPYRKNNPEGFRDVHRELLNAYQNKAAIKFTVLGFYEPDSLNAHEQAAIKRLRETHASEGLQVYNAKTRTKKRQGAN